MTTTNPPINELLNQQLDLSIELRPETTTSTYGSGLTWFTKYIEEKGDIDIDNFTLAILEDFVTNYAFNKLRIRKNEDGTQYTDIY